MKTDEIKKILDQLAGNINIINDPHATAVLKYMFNSYETLVKRDAILQAEKQRSTDENKRPKSEQGKVNIRKQLTGKQQKIKIDRQIICEIDKASLPEDAVFIGYQTQVVQDIKISPSDLKLLANKCMRK